MKKIVTRSQRRRERRFLCDVNENLSFPMKRREGIVCLPLPPSHLRTLSSRVLAHNPQDEAAASAPPEAFVYYVVAAVLGHRQPTIIYHGNISSLPPPEPTAAASPHSLRCRSLNGSLLGRPTAPIIITVAA